MIDDATKLKMLQLESASAIATKIAEGLNELEQLKQTAPDLAARIVECLHETMATHFPRGN